jgi:signal transduction histidine kinase
MSQLAFASRGTVAAGPSEDWAHDVRNALATVGLHLETLERLSGSHGREIAHAAHALMSRAAAMCSEAMARGAQADIASRRRPFEVGRIIAQIADLLRSTVPPGFEIRVADGDSCAVLADQHQVFRILFNLVHNAIAIARLQGEVVGRMTSVTLLVERTGATVRVRIADDGPGLPAAVRANLFRRQQSATGGSGTGLSIARELAEQNGGVLQLAESARGTVFVLELPAGAAIASAESGALRSLGKRFQH